MVFLFNIFYFKCVVCLQIKNKLEHIRIKDISSYLFSASYLGLPPKDDNVCKIIMSFLDQILANKENSKKMSTELTGICLSMWMLDFKPIKLMTFLLSELSVNAIKSKYFCFYNVSIIKLHLLVNSYSVLLIFV